MKKKKKKEELTLQKHYLFKKLLFENDIGL